MNESEILSFWKCPNCWSNNFCINTRKCSNCWYSLYHNNVSKKITDTQTDLTEWISPKISEHKIKLSLWKYESYKVLENNWYIIAIKFHFHSNKWIKNFRIFIDYNLSKKHIQEKRFYETDKEEKILEIDLHKIDNLHISGIQEKAHTWWKEKKGNPNYFKYLWIDFNSIRKFIIKVIKEYHNIL